jgi:hypothetical protein
MIPSRLIVILLLCLGSYGTIAEAKTHRSAAARHAFQREHPCPLTGKTKGSCPGYIIDHVVPLCAGGEDKPINMQWQTVDEAKVKDRAERKQCKRK